MTATEKTTTIKKELNRLTQIVTGIVEANGFGVVETFTRDYICRNLNCGLFTIDIYLYPHLADYLPHVWITRTSNEPDDLTPLVEQLKLTGFDVDFVIENVRALK